MSTNDTPEVWIGCLACYNEGRLVGDWVDAIDAADLTAQDVHAREAKRQDDARIAQDTRDHEELWVMDHEGFDGLLEGACSPVRATELAEAISAIRADGIDVEAVAAWLGHEGRELEQWDAPTRGDFSDAYCGEWDSEEDYAQDFAENIGAVDPNATWPNSYIDWGRATRELMMDYYTRRASDGMVYIFHI